MYIYVQLRLKHYDTLIEAHNYVFGSISAKILDIAELMRDASKLDTIIENQKHVNKDMIFDCIDNILQYCVNEELKKKGNNHRHTQNSLNTLEFMNRNNNDKNNAKKDDNMSIQMQSDTDNITIFRSLEQCYNILDIETTMCNKCNGQIPINSYYDHSISCSKLDYNRIQQNMEQPLNPMNDPVLNDVPPYVYDKRKSYMPNDDESLGNKYEYYVDGKYTFGDDNELLYNKTDAVLKTIDESTQNLECIPPDINTHHKLYKNIDKNNIFYKIKNAQIKNILTDAKNTNNNKCPSISPDITRKIYTTMLNKDNKQFNNKASSVDSINSTSSYHTNPDNIFSSNNYSNKFDNSIIFNANSRRGRPRGTGRRRAPNSVKTFSANTTVRGTSNKRGRSRGRGRGRGRKRNNRDDTNDNNTNKRRRRNNSSTDSDSDTDTHSEITHLNDTVSEQERIRNEKLDEFNKLYNDIKRERRNNNEYSMKTQENIDKIFRKELKKQSFDKYKNMDKKLKTCWKYRKHIQKEKRKLMDLFELMLNCDDTPKYYVRNHEIGVKLLNQLLLCGFETNTCGFVFDKPKLLHTIPIDNTQNESYSDSDIECYGSDTNNENDISNLLESNNDTNESVNEETTTNNKSDSDMDMNDGNNNDNNEDRNMEMKMYSFICREKVNNGFCAVHDNWRKKTFDELQQRLKQEIIEMRQIDLGIHNYEALIEGYDTILTQKNNECNEYLDDISNDNSWKIENTFISDINSICLSSKHQIKIKDTSIASIIGKRNCSHKIKDININDDNLIDSDSDVDDIEYIQKKLEYIKKNAKIIKKR